MNRKWWIRTNEIREFPLKTMEKLEKVQLDIFMDIDKFLQTISEALVTYPITEQKILDTVVVMGELEQLGVDVVELLKVERIVKKTENMGIKITKHIKGEKTTHKILDENGVSQELTKEILDDLFYMIKNNGVSNEQENSL